MSTTRCRRISLPSSVTVSLITSLTSSGVRVGADFLVIWRILSITPLARWAYSSIRAAAAAAFDLPADRIGDLIVLGDAHTVLGRSRDVHDLSALHGTLRSHGGLHERIVPLIVCAPLPAGALAGRQLHNRDLHDLLLNVVTA